MRGREGNCVDWVFAGAEEKARVLYSIDLCFVFFVKTDVWLGYWKLPLRCAWLKREGVWKWAYTQWNWRSSVYREVAGGARVAFAWRKWQNSIYQTKLTLCSEREGSKSGEGADKHQLCNRQFYQSQAGTATIRARTDRVWCRVKLENVGNVNGAFGTHPISHPTYRKRRLASVSNRKKNKKQKAKRSSTLIRSYSDRKFDCLSLLHELLIKL